MADHPSMVTVVCAQLAPVFGDLNGNRARAAEAITSAARGGAGLVVLPELCTTGYAFADESEARGLGETAGGPTLDQWSELAAAHQLVIVGGFCELDPRGDVCNSAAVVDRQGVRCVYRKTHLWDRERLIFRPGGSPPPVVTTSVGRIGLAICYDAFFPEVMRSLALAGAELIAVPMNSPLTDAPSPPLAAEVVLALAAALVNRVYVAQADRGGRERGIEWAQASVICDPDGRLLAGPMPEIGLLRADCDLAAASDKRLGPRNDALADRRPELYNGDGPTTPAKETIH